MISSTWEKVTVSLGIQFQTVITAAFSQGRRGKGEKKKWRWGGRSIGWQEEVVKEDITKTVTEGRRTELGFHYRTWWNSYSPLFPIQSAGLLVFFFFHLFFIASSLHSLLFSCHVISKRQGLKIWETLIQSVQIDYTIYKYVRRYKCKYVDIYQICSSAVDWLVSLRMPQCLCVCVCVCVFECALLWET